MRLREQGEEALERRPGATRSIGDGVHAVLDRAGQIGQRRGGRSAAARRPVSERRRRGQHRAGDIPRRVVGLEPAPADEDVAQEVLAQAVGDAPSDRALGE
jgi:hypothetical protein